MRPNQPKALDSLINFTRHDAATRLVKFFAPL